MPDTPEWYDESKLRKAYYDTGYTGWIIDNGDGTCHYANNPLLGEGGPNWGDKVRLIPPGPGQVFPTADSSEILERYNPEIK
jgi:hypothetical protein